MVSLVESGKKERKINLKFILDAKSEFTVAQNDSGGVVAQIINLTEEIANISQHLEVHPKDFATKVNGLIHRVVRRKRLLKYLEKKQAELARNLKDRLGIRK